MLRTYFKIAWRNRLYSFINIFGLTTGLTCCLLIGVYISDELSYDKFNVNADRIVRATMEYSTGGGVTDAAQTGTKVGPQFKRIFPEVEDYARLMKYHRVIGYGDKLFTEENFLYADSSFFKIFSFPFVMGNSATALNTADKVVLTQKAAKKYFGDADPMGKVLKINDRDFSVSGVVKDVPGHSQVQFDFVISFNNLLAASTEEWWTANYITYFLLHNKDDISKVQQKVSAYMQTDAVRKEYGREGSDYLTYHLEPLTSVHLYSSLDGPEPNGSITSIYILGLIALLILAIACVNYTNLSTAQAAGRSAEIGVRKVMGALRRQLFVQFIGESVLTTFLALLAALFLTTQLLPLLDSITGKQLTASAIFQLKPLLFIFLGSALIGLAAGLYPALILSGTVIIKILKAGFSFSPKESSLRKSLIVFQFVVSVFLIIATIIILQQINYIRSKNLGYDKEHILQLPIEGSAHKNYPLLKKQISSLPSVSSVTGGYSSPLLVEWGDGISVDNGHDRINLSINAIPVDLDFIKTTGMQIVAGSDYTLSDLADTSNIYSYMLNETAVKKIGWTPEEAIGKTIEGNRTGTVRAVIKDFHFQSLHQPIGPLMTFLDTGFVRNMLIKISGDNMQGTIAQVDKIWKGLVPDRPFEYKFLDDEYNSMYNTEQHTAQLFSVFSGLAILLACLGLFGLAAFTTVQRTKEIGIRKVLGASVTGIIGLLSKDFLKLVTIAIFIASPISWWAMNKWLEDFAYRVSISWWIFGIAAILALLIAWATTSFHAIKAAMANPVKSLRTE